VVLVAMGRETSVLLSKVSGRLLVEEMFKRSSVRGDARLSF
jgi:hypothetical protein